MTLVASRYSNRVKVVGEDLLCFPADPDTLAPSGCSCYDPWALSDPEPEPVETIGIGEWQRRRNEKHKEEYENYYCR